MCKVLHPVQGTLLEQRCGLVSETQTTFGFFGLILYHINVVYLNDPSKPFS